MAHALDIVRWSALHEQARLKRHIPADWWPCVERMKVDDGPEWMRAGLWLERLRQFGERHGTALRWNMTDAELCERADTVAADARWILDDGGLQVSEHGRIDIALSICRRIGVEPPAAVLGSAAVERVRSAHWWRRVMRKTVARVVEQGAISLGIVNGRTGSAYASDEAVQRRAQQRRRNAEALRHAAIINEAGQVYRIGDIAARSTADPEIRRAELMQRIRGSEEWADAAGHVGHFYTLTAPSRYHAMTTRGGKLAHNPTHDGSTPKDAQLWLRTTWARVRAAWARQGVQAYGVRVAEPHGDGCPHWHMLVWFADRTTAGVAHDIARAHWLKDDGQEPGAERYRIAVRRLSSGGAAAYVAKYIAKNLRGNDLVPQHIDGDAADMQPVNTGTVSGADRVDAWAATWGIRQFQFFGLPPVGVWRALRRVSADQADKAQQAGDLHAARACSIVHRSGDVLACWRSYLECMGMGGQGWQEPITDARGVCVAWKRRKWRMRILRRSAEGIDCYGAAVTRHTEYGILTEGGTRLISRRQVWKRAQAGALAEFEAQSAAKKAGIARPWSGFNNCTARLTGATRAELFAAIGIRHQGGNAWIVPQRR